MVLADITDAHAADCACIEVRGQGQRKRRETQQPPNSDMNTFSAE